MSMLGWLEYLRPKRPAAPEAVLARQLSESIAKKAHAIQVSLHAYSKNEDPFAALLADIYNRDQVSRIWKNGSQY